MDSFEALSIALSELPIRQRLLNITLVSVYAGQSVCPDYLPRSLLLERDLTIFSTAFQSLMHRVFPGLIRLCGIHLLVIL